MESIISSSKSSSSAGELFDLYGSDLKDFYMKIREQRLESAEKMNLLSWNLSAPLRVAVVGEYNHGKSSVINYLLGRQNLLPVSPKKETKITAYVFPLYFSNFGGFGVNNEHAVLVNRKEKSYRVIKIEDLKSTVNDPNIEPKDFELNIYIDNKILYNNVVFIDTPGFIIEKENEWYPVELAKLSDIILMVSDLNKPFTRYHDKFIKLLGPHSKKIVLAINKVELANNPSDIRDALTHVVSHQGDGSLSYPRFLVSVIDAKIEKKVIEDQLALMESENAEVKEEKKEDENITDSDSSEQDAENSVEPISESDIDLKPGEWENMKLWNHLCRKIIGGRAAHKAENWALNISEMLSGEKTEHEGETHEILKTIQSSVKRTDSESQTSEEIHSDILEKRLISESLIEEKVQELEEEIKKSVYEYSNTANVSIAEKLMKCTRRKEVDRTQDTLRKDLRRHIEEAFTQIDSAVAKQTAELNLYWFGLLSGIPDGRILDNSLTQARAEEIRAVLYDYLFEEQYFGRHASWDGLLELLKKKGFSTTEDKLNKVAWFLRTMREIYFDCGSSDYLLRRIVNELSFPEFSQKDRGSILSVHWTDVKKPGFLIFGSSVKKYKSRVQQYVQNYQLNKFNLLKKVLLKFVNDYRESAKTALHQIETDLRESLAKEILNIHKRSVRKETEGQLESLNKMLKNTSLPFKSTISG